MKKQDFIKLVNGGHITNVYVVEKYMNDETALNNLTLQELHNYGYITKSAAFELINEDDAVTEAPIEVTEEPTTTTPALEKSSKKETTEAPIEVTEEPITEAPADDIVVDEGDDE